MGTLPTISLAMIIKNEKKNLPRLLESVENCFHEICITDTGSTDGSVEWLKENGEQVAKCPIKVSHFEWVNDFAKARNFSFSQTTSDFVLWLDADDVLTNKLGFIQWRDTAMQYNDFVFATYHYALDKDGKPIVSFVRERVFRKSLEPTWRYPLHEGILLKPGLRTSYATTWAVNHLRDAEDIAQDKSRNIKILEQMKDLDGRMSFYWGKELYEAARPFEALPALEASVQRTDLEPHDKMLALQYAAYAAMACATQLKDEMKDQKNHYYERAIDACSRGVRINPHRAELYMAIGDCYVQMGKLQESIPYFAAAKHCINPKTMSGPYEGAIYSFVNCYGELPSLNLSKVYFHLGDLEKAKIEAEECHKKYGNLEAKNVISETERVSKLVSLDNDQVQTEDIVFSCPPQNAMEFDEKLYQEKGCGGSETALVEMAMALKKLTGRNVKVFNMRKDDYIAESGVEYISNTKLNFYMSQFRPRMHIAWRHNIKLTKAKTYLWCHDLFTQSVESFRNFDKIMCLTPFHKEYVKGLQGIPDEMIYVTRNGINPEKFNFPLKPKNPRKIVWMSSADRGLDSCMRVMDEVVKEITGAELHVYYGYENLYKYGPQMSALADKIKAMIAERPYVHYHGFTEQSKMYQEVADASIWLHPCNWIETSCITAMEMQALKVYPVTRSLGALNDTLKEAKDNGWADLLDHEFDSDTMAFTEKDIKLYYQKTCSALLSRPWEKIQFDLKKHSWESVAKEWIEEMGL